MKNVLIITIALMLAGCAASVMKTWVGQDEAEVLASWGAPHRTARAGGKTIHTWDRRNAYGNISHITRALDGQVHFSIFAHLA